MDAQGLNYSAWLWATDSLLNLFEGLGTNPYKARQIYVALTDNFEKNPWPTPAGYGYLAKVESSKVSAGPRGYKE